MRAGQSTRSEARQVLRHAQRGVYMAGARQQHHGLAGDSGLHECSRHRAVPRDLDPRHRPDLGFGQQPAVAHADGLAAGPSSAGAGSRLSRRRRPWRRACWGAAGSRRPPERPRAPRPSLPGRRRARARPVRSSAGPPARAASGASRGRPAVDTPCSAISSASAARLPCAASAAPYRVHAAGARARRAARRAAARRQLARLRAGATTASSSVTRQRW